MSKTKNSTTRPRFKVGDSAFFIGLGCYDIPGDTYGPFPVTKVKDMTNYAGWEDGSQLVYVNLVGRLAKAMESSLGETTANVIGGLAVLTGSVLIFAVWLARHTVKKRRFKKSLGLWQRSWVCNKCGAVWSR